MERIALQKLIDWNNNKRKKPLIVWGARQVGKTYLVEELFAKKYYKVLYGNTIKKMIIPTPDFFAQKLFFDFT